MKFLMFMFAMLLAPAMSFAMTNAESLNAEFGLNRSSPEAMFKYRLGTLVMKGMIHENKVTWNFSDQGGAVGTYNMHTSTSFSPKLPANAIIMGCYIDAVTTPVGSGSIAFSSGKTAGDILAATTATSLTGIVACIPTGSAASSIKLTADVQPTITISSAALTAGKINLHLLYILSQ